MSVKWAACNVGTEFPSDYGNHYAWGETESKECYDWLSYFDSVQRNNHYFKKYDIGHKDQLDLEYDVAHVQMVKSWRMPTKDEFDELLSRCAWIWSKYEGHGGYFVVGSTGNAIFLPAGGYYEGYRQYDEGCCGRYWSSSYVKNSPDSHFPRFFASGTYRASIGNVSGTLYVDYRLVRDTSRALKWQSTEKATILPRCKR